MEPLRFISVSGILVLLGAISVFLRLQNNPWWDSRNEESFRSFREAALVLKQALEERDVSRVKWRREVHASVEDLEKTFASVAATQKETQRRQGHDRDDRGAAVVRERVEEKTIKATPTQKHVSTYFVPPR